MKKLFGLMVLAVLFAFVSIPATYAYDTGPPGIEVIVESENSEIGENALCIFEIDLRGGVIVLGPGDFMVKRCDACKEEDSSLYLHYKSNTDYAINNERRLAQLTEVKTRTYTSDLNLTKSQWLFKGRCTFN